MLLWIYYIDILLNHEKLYMCISCYNAHNYYNRHSIDIKHSLDLTFYGYFNTCMACTAGVTSFCNFILFSSKQWLYWIYHTSKHIKRIRVQVFIPFIAKDVAIIRILVTGGGHLEFSHEKVGEKMETDFTSPLGSI